MSLETPYELDWGLDQLETVQTHWSVSDMASSKVRMQIIILFEKIVMGGSLRGQTKQTFQFPDFIVQMHKNKCHLFEIYIINKSYILFTKKHLI